MEHPSARAFDIAPEEAEAVRLLWEREGGGPEGPSETEFLQLLGRVRKHREAIEAEARRLTLDAMRSAEGRRRQLVAMLLTLLILSVAFGALVLVLRMLGLIA